MRSATGQIVWDAAAASHLLSRAAFGGAPGEADRLAAGTLEDAVDSLLDAAAGAPTPPAPDWVRDPWVNTERRYADTPREESSAAHRATQRRYDEELNSLRCWWLGEMIGTPAPLREVMTLFWHGHFTTATGKVRVSQAIYQQNATLRRLALGNFRELLGEVTRDAAMMMYLDLEDSDRSNPNENYARELLELFTLGIGRYGEPDIKEAARALTGWTLDAPPGPPPTGRATAPGTPRGFSRDGLVATFRPDRHDAGTKTVLGRTGRLGVDDVLDVAAGHGATAAHLASKLVAFFGADDPSGRLRGRVVSAFADSGGGIRPALRALLTGPEFYSEESRGTQIKSPVRLLVGACRQLRLDVEPTPSLAQLTAAMGEELFNPPNVKGWPGGRSWIGAGTLAVRYRLADALIGGRPVAGLDPIGRDRFLVVPRDPAAGGAMVARMVEADRVRRDGRARDGIRVRFDPASVFPEGAPGRPGALVDALLGRLVATAVPPSTRAALVDACEKTPAPERTAVVAALILSSPEYQLA